MSSEKLPGAAKIEPREEREEQVAWRNFPLQGGKSQGHNVRIDCKVGANSSFRGASGPWRARLSFLPPSKGRDLRPSARAKVLTIWPPPSRRLSRVNLLNSVRGGCTLSAPIVSARLIRSCKVFGFDFIFRSLKNERRRKVSTVN